MDIFFTNYSKWLAQSLKDYNKRYSQRRCYHQQTVPKNYIPGQFVEFAENGHAYPHGVFGIAHIPDAVTPWNESEYYVA